LEKPKLTRQKLLVIFLITVAFVALTLKTNAASNSTETPSPSSLTGDSRFKVLWEKTFGGAGDDRAFYALANTDGNLIVGSSRSILENQTVAWVIQLNADGDYLWKKSYSSGYASEFRYALNLSDGFLLVGNSFSPSKNYDGFIVRTNWIGDVIWNMTLGGDLEDEFFSAIQVSDGFVLAGLSSSFSSGGSDIWVVKLNLDGSLSWSRNFGGAGEDAARSVTNADEGFVVAGYTNSQGSGNYDYILLKIDSVGNLIWNCTYGGKESDKAYGVAKLADGYVLAGDTQSKGNGDSDAWVVKVNLQGSLVWDKVIGGSNFDMPTFISASPDDSVLVCGFTFSYGNGQRDFWFFKLNGQGNVTWIGTVGRSQYEEAYAALELGEGKFMLVGWTNSIGQGHYDYYVVNVKVGEPTENSAPYFIIGLFAVIVLFLAVFYFCLTKNHEIKS
jgi:hypothetical protein